MKTGKENYREQLLKVIKIQDQIIASSSTLDEAIKNASLSHSKLIVELLTDKLSLGQLESLAKDVMIFWQEGIGLEVELFWTELRVQNIDVERKDELNFALAQGRFRRVDQGMAARLHWSTLKSLASITRRYGDLELQKIDQIIAEDESKRLAILKKCLRKKSIAPTQYLKFGECMAYFATVELFYNYFTEDEVIELYSIWNNF
jgi:hypothetical protein